MFQPESRTLAALWFIITWPIFITWLIAKVCFKEPTRTDDKEVVPAAPVPAPVPEPVQKDLSDAICELLSLGSFTARDLLLELRDQADAGCLTSDGSPLVITKHDVNSCLYSLKAAGYVTSRQRTKKSPIWSLVGADTLFTLYELSAFDYETGHPEYVANCRGDVVNSRWEYAGHFDFHTRVRDPFARRPADWNALMDNIWFL
jgi:hypothetical protein